MKNKNFIVKEIKRYFADKKNLPDISKFSNLIIKKFISD